MVPHLQVVAVHAVQSKNEAWDPSLVPLTDKLSLDMTQSSYIVPRFGWHSALVDAVHQHLEALAGAASGTSNLVTHVVVLFLHALDLLLQVLHVAVFASKLFLEVRDLADTTNVLRRLAIGCLCVALKDLDLLLETKNIEDHDVGAIQDERQEKGETTEVHVALRVELACLDFHALDASKAGVSAALLVAHAAEFDLYTIDPVDAVNEKDEDEDESDLHAILQFRHDWTLRDEGEELTAPCEWQRNDESTEDDHLCHQEEEN